MKTFIAGVLILDNEAQSIYFENNLEEKVLLITNVPTPIPVPSAGHPLVVAGRGYCNWQVKARHLEFSQVDEKELLATLVSIRDYQGSKVALMRPAIQLAQSILAQAEPLLCIAKLAELTQLLPPLYNRCTGKSKRLLQAYLKYIRQSAAETITEIKPDTDTNEPEPDTAES